jgi:hypothetical protein
MILARARTLNIPKEIKPENPSELACAN